MGECTSASGGPGRRPVFPVTQSVPDAAALGREVERLYGLPGPVAVLLLNRWLSDVYLVRAGGHQYILKVYRAGWRSLDAIVYELDLARHLAARGVGVSVPIARRDGAFVTALDAPEGLRHAVLFTYAPGRPPRVDASTGAAYGRLAASLHAAMDGFASGHGRFALDLDHLLHRPLAALGPFLEDRPADRAFLHQTAERLAREVGERASAGLSWGVCHGDLHGGNVHVDADGSMTAFDLDCAGAGWRAYDLAVFRWGTLPSSDADATWAAFLDGYRSVRPLDPRDLEAVPAFVACRAVWFAGLLAANSQHLGAGWLREWHLDELVSFLHERAVGRG